MPGRLTMLALIGFLLGGCSAPQTTSSIDRQDQDAINAGWQVSCTEDRYKDVRRCFAVRYSKAQYLGKAPLEVSFLDGIGPFLRVGWHDSAISRATVRVDDRKPHWLTNYNPFMPERAPVHIAEARALVKDLREGKTAYATYSTARGSEQRFEVDLSGFREAYDQLLEKVKERHKTAFTDAKY